ncbi:MAG: nucleotidyltransferase, partial [Acidobacteria bacterium]
HKAAAGAPAPTTAPAGSERRALRRLMRRRQVLQIPLLDPRGRVVELIAWDDLLPAEPLALDALVMAGGTGERLRPLTAEVPKPLLEVGDRPLLERLIARLRDAGIERLTLAVGYRGQQVIDHFGDGGRFGLAIDYLREDEPLGTAGAIGLLPPPGRPLLVVNGDILTGVDFAAMLRYHQEHHATLTVALRRHEVQVPFGVVECDGERVVRLREKPLFTHLVSAGFYILEPEVHRRVERGRPCDMPELIGRLLDDGRPVIGFPVHEYWLDVGDMESYARALDDVRGGRVGG